MRASAIETAEHIATIEAKGASQGAGPDLKAKLRAAMRTTHRHWCIAQCGQGLDAVEIRAAVGGVMCDLGIDHPDAQRLAAEHRALAQLGATLEAMQRGVPVDLARANEQHKTIRAAGSANSATGAGRIASDGIAGNAAAGSYPTSSPISPDPDGCNQEVACPRCHHTETHEGGPYRKPDPFDRTQGITITPPRRPE